MSHAHAPSRSREATAAAHAEPRRDDLDALVRAITAVEIHCRGLELSRRSSPCRR
jgi:hypothetical protein